MGEIRKRITFHGRVQGVGFRYTARLAAGSLGLTGWAKNEYDGTVTMEVQGSEGMINKLLVSPSSRRAWIEIAQPSAGAVTCGSRPPRGGRG